MNPQKSRTILTERPAEEDAFTGGGHKRSASVLSNAIREVKGEDRAIGLDGPFGSGKSSVVAMARKMLAESAKSAEVGVQYHFFTFDIWKSQNSGFRRSLLENLLDWAGDVEWSHGIAKKEVEEIRKNVTGKITNTETKAYPSLSLYGIFVGLILPLLPLYYLWFGQTLAGMKGNAGANTGSIWSSWPACILYVFFGVTFTAGIYNAWSSKKREDKENWIEWVDRYRVGFSRLIMATARREDELKSTQYVREIDPNDREFGRLLRKILQTVQTDKHRVVMVLDNIDRLPPDEIQEYWGLVRSVFARSASAEHAKHGNSAMTVIVPFDRAHIGAASRHVEAGSGSNQPTNPGSALTDLSRRELLFKTFDEIVTVAPPVLSNAREFFDQQFKEALGSNLDPADIFTAHRIFSELLRRQNSAPTPRQIISFVNQAAGYYTQHEGRFSLPIIAAYIAFEDTLRANPYVLAQPEGLDSEIEAMVRDGDLRKSLAALAFNVEPELAFQILLDDKIFNAITAAEPSELETVAKSPGFEERFASVIASRFSEALAAPETDQTSQSDRNELADRALLNVVSFLKNYQGASAKVVRAAVVKKVAALKRVRLGRGDFDATLGVFDITDDANAATALVEGLARAAFASTTASESPGMSPGSHLARFLSRLADAAKKHTDEQELPPSALSQFEIKAAPAFLVGFASECGDKHGHLEHLRLTPPQEINFNAELGTIAKEYPHIMSKALPVLDRSIWLDSEGQLAITKACVEELSNADVAHEKRADLWQVMSDSAAALERGNHGSDWGLEAAISKGQLFKNLQDEAGNAATERVMLLAYHLAKQHLGRSVPQPTTRNPQNGQRTTDSSVGYERVNAVLSGGGSPTATEFKTLAGLIIRYGTVERWLEMHSVNPDHPLLKDTLPIVLMDDKSRDISLYVVIQRFAAISGMLGADLPEFIDRVGDEIFDVPEGTVLVDNFPDHLISTVGASSAEGWQRLLDEAKRQVNLIDEDRWKRELREGGPLVNRLAELCVARPTLFLDARFHKPFAECVIATLNGEAAPVFAGGTFDLINSAVDRRLHSANARNVREKLSGVSRDTLRSATALFPTFLTEHVMNLDDATPGEQEAVVRQIVINALLDQNKPVLDAVIARGYRKMKNTLELCTSATTESLKAAQEEFSNAAGDRDWARRVVESMQGKKRTEGFWLGLFGSNRD